LLGGLFGHPDRVADLAPRRAGLLGLGDVVADELVTEVGQGLGRVWARNCASLMRARSLASGSSSSRRTIRSARLMLSGLMRQT